MIDIAFANNIDCVKILDYIYPIPINGCAIGSVSCADQSYCVPVRYICNCQIDCQDGSDEENCNTYCPGTKICLGPSKTCDGVIHCPDASDEQNCRPCPEGLVPCSEHPTQCIHDYYHCDGWMSNCPQGSDENCTVCPAGTFRCATTVITKCIRNRNVCNGYDLDCPMLPRPAGARAEDEQNCHFCQNSAFRCATGNECAEKHQVCNGRNDCQDRSDEDHCDLCPSDRPWRCPNTTKCIDVTERGTDINIYLCKTASNEDYCNALAMAYHVNVTEVFHCDDGRCLRPEELCTGKALCEDQTDLDLCYKIPCHSRYVELSGKSSKHLHYVLVALPIN